MSGLKTWLFLGSLWLAAGCGKVAGPGAWPPYNLSVPEGSSGCIKINISENSSLLCKMQTAIAATSYHSACDPILALINKEIRNYNSTFKGRISLSDQLVTVKNASKWMAAEYQVLSFLHGTCMARINLTVPDSVPAGPVSETPSAGEGTANLTGEGSSRGTLSNGSPEREPGGLYGVWISLGFITALFAAAVLYVCWKRVREGPGTRRGCEEEGISDSADSPVCVPACASHLHEAGTRDREAGEEIPLN
ncbi:uncharacterized protein LOC117870444 isoform X1 [Trachemys scripta elegans]|uniref:uncharacterized protein LOC117870444 isoform X1 n=1 Tax=Trachemys scripta elegans TaxID=31138 RepID=UPI001551FDE1|nr:uncharacterized protein LOC117870444 isoform X1 [Trachemys scripta elegans]